MAVGETLTVKQVRAGRALLAWSQQELARRAGITASALADFERGGIALVPNKAHAIQTALEVAGISFSVGGAVEGKLLPSFSPTTKSGSPIRWITQTDLAQWSDRRDGQSVLPALLSKLIRASGCASVHFPSDEAVQHPGWDGESTANEQTQYVPAGSCGWEIGTQRENISTKANEDYGKRTSDPSHLIQEESVFIFVTPRPWPKKEQWAKEKRTEKAWRDVRAYDGTDLVHWIETYPAVGHWLASYLGKRPSGIMQIEEVWQEWSLATQWPLSTDLILSDRDESSVDILTWLRSSADYVAFQGDTAEEVCAFLYAVINQLPDNISEHYRARCLVATTPEQARALADSISPMILVLIDPQPGLAQAIAQKGHHVLCAYGSSALVSNPRRLDRPSREGIRAALLNADIPERDADRFAREASRSLAILRRLMAGEAGSIPTWAGTPPPRTLLAAMLIGGWDEDSEADKSALARLSGVSYDAFITDIPRYSGYPDSPLRKVGSTWKIASPQDIWLLLASYLSNADLVNFEDIAIVVLSSVDPRYSMKPEERWLAPLKKIKPDYSEVLRRGVGETLIMLALFGGRAYADPDVINRPSRIVHTILREADSQRWWSLSTEFQLLAEAAPLPFLQAVEHSLSQDEPAIFALFESDTAEVSGAEYLSNILSALEALAWAPQHVGQVSNILARLDAIDPGGRFSNRPENSLRDIFLLWCPQTSATLAQRLKVLDRLQKNHPEQAWKLLLAILPGGHDSVSPSGSTRWRVFTQTAEEVISYPLIHHGAREVTARLLEGVELNVGRWVELLDRLSDIPEEDLDTLLTQLSAAGRMIIDESDRKVLWNHLRRVINNHRAFPDAEWSLDEKKVAVLGGVYALLSPHDPIQRVSWLFDQGVLLERPLSDWEKNEELLAETRALASVELIKSHGINAIFDLACCASDPASLGRSIIYGKIEQDQLVMIIEKGLRSDDVHHQRMAQAAIGARTQHQDPWFETIFNNAIREEWGPEPVLLILQSVRVTNWTWKLASDAGADIERDYWCQVAVHGIDATADEIEFVLTRLIDSARARDALHFLGTQNRLQQLSTAALLNVLRQAAIQPYRPNVDHHSDVMFQYHLERALSHLDRVPDVDEKDMLDIELAYLPILEYSKRPPKVIPKSMAESPELFVQVICAIFKPSTESGIFAEEAGDPVRARDAARQASHILRVWDVIPGLGPDGKIDQKALDTWVESARKQAKAKGRGEFADGKIGEVLALSPVGEDGIWPAAEIRELIESLCSEQLELGFVMGHRNLRGVTSRLLGEGGAQERERAVQFKAYAQETAFEWHRTSAVLNAIAAGYEADAKWHDEMDNRLDL